jgi:hypothetical protein
MILYNVTVNIENDICEDWLQWMVNKHIPDVMNTGIFKSYKLLRLLNEEEGNTGTTFAVQYFCENIQAYNTYKNEFATKLQKEYNLRYQGKFVAFRTLLEVVATA